MRRLKYFSIMIMLSMALAACGQTGAEPKTAPEAANPPAQETAAKKDADQAAEKKEADKADETGKTAEQTERKKLTIVLDWVPNTNHTGLFVAKDKGYFAEEGLDVDIVQPAEDSASVIVGMGRAEFGIHFQPNMVKRLVAKTPITAVAAILQHNTGGIMSLKSSGISSPKELTGKKYSTWEDPIDDATVRFITEKDGGD